MTKDNLMEWPPEYDRTFIPSDDSPYWNREVETMDPAQREEEVILPKLQRSLDMPMKTHLFTRKSGIRRVSNPKTSVLWTILNRSPL